MDVSTHCPNPLAPQLEEAVRLGGWPEDVGKLLLEKLIERNDLVRAFDLEKTQEIMPVDRKLTTPSGIVQNGHLTQGKVPGYEQNFGNYYSDLFRPVPNCL